MPSCVRCGKPAYSSNPRCKYCLTCHQQVKTERVKACPSQTPDKQANRSGEHYRRVYRKRVAVLGDPKRCAICGHPFKEITVNRVDSPNWDHDHNTGNPRGWLCLRCNRGLGLMGDNPRLLRAAAEYLEERGCSVTRSVLR